MQQLPPVKSVLFPILSGMRGKNGKRGETAVTVFEFLRTARKKVVTNADKIRNMTDEQLAEMFIRVSELPAYWKNSFLDWLKKEAEP